MLRLRGFLPYAVVGVAHLVALFFAIEPLIAPSKYALMPALALGLVLGRARGTVLGWAAAGILLSWAGDVLISTPGSLGFLAGLGAFLLAHLAYLVLFVRAIGVRRVPWISLAYVVWFGALLAVLAPSLGTLLTPVAVYGLVLGASAAAASGVSPVVAVGGLLFLASDTILALKFFLPEFALWQSDFVIMTLYISGQLLIVAGVTLRQHASSREDENGLI